VIRTLLLWGLLAGLCAGVAAAGVGAIAGEPALERAIRFEQTMEPTGGHEHPAVVGRTTQRTVGLLLACGVYGASVGGLFALAFAAAYGRLWRAGPARTALGLAAAGFVVVYLVPFLKYPANPPAVGHADTIATRTSLYFVMVGISLLGALAAARLGRLAPPAWRARRAAITAGAFAVIVGLATAALPAVHEVPDGFASATLWEFRAASAAMHVVLWAVLGGVFALATRRVLVRQGALAPSAH